MPSIYTCPHCQKRYTIYRDGDYICDCGQIFSYPPLLSSEKANFIALSPTYIDSASKSVKRSFHVDNRRRRRSRGGEDCPLAKASLICGILGLIFFGVTALPGLILGVSAQVMISDPYYNYRGTGMAISGTVLSLLGGICWGIWFYSRFMG